MHSSLMNKLCTVLPEKLARMSRNERKMERERNVDVDAEVEI